MWLRIYKINDSCQNKDIKTRPLQKRAACVVQFTSKIDAARGESRLCHFYRNIMFDCSK